MWWSAVFMMTVLSMRGPYSGCACIISAATPATKGVDMDVPVFTLEPVPLPTSMEEMFVPGAATSGLVMPCEPCRPRAVEVFA